MGSTKEAVICAPLIDAAEEFRAVMVLARKAAEPINFSWYPYDSLGNSVHLTKLLKGSGFDFVSLVKDQRILDLGCADGDFAFFLESLGASVVAVDHPRSNHNNLRGITTLRAQMNSSVEVRRMDLDAGVDTGKESFGLAIALGLLYHLKNPFQFLESLSRCARYCVLSTRVMRRLPGVVQDVSGIPVAYFLDADELNGDNSNFWIFTDAALRRLLERAHWRVLASTTVGNISDSDPHTLENDERAFCLVESTYGQFEVKLGQGWHEPEDTGWRWTARTFNATAEHAQKGAFVTAAIYVPDALIAGYGPITLGLSVNGISVNPQVFSNPGLYTFTRRIPAAAEHLDLTFTVSHTFPPDALDSRERSLIVESIRIENA